MAKEKTCSITLFDYLNAICKKEKTLENYLVYFEDNNWYEFSAFMLMKYLFFGNYITQANLINKYMYCLDKKQLFIMMYKTVPKNFQFIKWIKKDKDENKLLEYIVQNYACNETEAKDYMKFMTKEDYITILKKWGIEEKKIKKLVE
jgi:hypothetical protein